MSSLAVNSRATRQQAFNTLYFENALRHTTTGQKIVKELKSNPLEYARCTRVMNCPGETSMPLSEAIQISRYIYGGNLQGKSSQLLPGTTTLLPRDLLYDAEQKKVAIVASKGGCSIQVPVSYKVIRSATFLSLQAPETCTRAVFAQMSPLYDRTFFDFELESLQKLAKVPGLVRVLSAIKTGENACMLLEGFDHDLMYMIRNRGAFTQDQRLQVAVKTTETLMYLRKFGFLHNDLKEPNIVFKVLPDGTIEVAIIDLSLSCYAGAKGRASSFMIPGLYNAYYGTAPELLGKTVTDEFPAHEALYQGEVFALGSILWHLFDEKGDYAPWVPALTEYYETTQNNMAASVLPTRRRCAKEFQDFLELFVEKPYNEIMINTAPACRTHEQRIRAALCKMLLPSPQKRAGAEEAHYLFTGLLEAERKRVATANNNAAAAGAGAAASVDQLTDAVTDMKLDRN